MDRSKAKYGALLDPEEGRLWEGGESRRLRQETTSEMVESVRLAHLPSEFVLYVAAFSDVENAPYLREQLLAGNQEFNYAFIDATTVISRKHILAAAFRALNDFLNDRLKSNNVHSEIVFSLSPNNNIGEAFRRFGVQDTSRNIIVVKVATNAAITQESVAEHLNSSIKGKPIAFDDDHLRDISDLDRILKVYKLTAKPSGKKGVNGQAGRTLEERLDLERQILGLMALRGAT